MGSTFENRGGSGVLRVLIDKNYQVAEHNIILGLNPDYMIVGGDFGKYKEILLEVITSSGKITNEEIRYEGAKIIFSGLEDKGPLVGASLLPLEVIFNHNENVI